ncbi:hypothetical protein SteCoe_18655 [Stentor coeruleus]|uniref:VWFA domain-containing protein n=1 Tax=Stentor coeruleus TaxID=5963 RepID=A0A1R2BW85_9CILI|nr:hypothetical protein SteCoe_18655 [Stentor coeruleus]
MVVQFFYFLLVSVFSETNRWNQCNGQYFTNCLEYSPYVYPEGQKDSEKCVRSWTGGLKNQDSTLFSHEFIYYHEVLCLCGYVPAKISNDECVPIENSSTTVGIGVDLGNMNSETLVSDYGVSKEFSQQLSPYCGLSGTDAIKYLQNNPLTLTLDQATRISEGAFNSKYNYTANLIEKKCSYSFQELSYAQRTAIFSMVYQGALKFPSTASGHICNKDWKSLINYLRDPNKSYKCRRRDESDIIAVDLQSCTNPYSDICFIVDESGSISGSDYNLSKTFLKDFISGTMIGIKETQFAIVRFSSPTICEVYFNTYTENDKLIDYINSIIKIDESTNTNYAIDYAREYVFKNSSGARDPELGYGRVAIVITDGNSNVPNLTADAALRLRNAGITIYAIGVGSATYSELLNIAGTSNNVFTPQTYQDLINILINVKKTACSTPGQSTVNSEIKVQLTEGWLIIVILNH